ncbi:uncharacterized protein LOC113147426 [Cyclospora cayetanensis]|uniref:Uncharacterized protein LOC113147426 n=1 Tax=Cyclospora cayetanensis TaxID=88456 RepID=A0A6P6S1W4_9EIME|nr:uncharacterized protein LOC113147426 [Cyclospora cayetanensis]
MRRNAAAMEIILRHDKALPEGEALCIRGLRLAARHAPVDEADCPELVESVAFRGIRLNSGHSQPYGLALTPATEADRDERRNRAAAGISQNVPVNMPAAASVDCWNCSVHKLYAVIALALLVLPDDIEKIVMQVLDDLLRDKEYDEQQASDWTDRICDNCMRRLSELKRPYKYVVHANLAQQGTGSLHLASAGTLCSNSDAIVPLGVVVATGVVSCIWPEERIHDRASRGVKAAVRVFGFAF